MKKQITIVSFLIILLVFLLALKISNQKQISLRDFALSFVGLANIDDGTELSCGESVTKYGVLKKGARGVGGFLYYNKSEEKETIEKAKNACLDDIEYSLKSPTGTGGTFDPYFAGNYCSENRLTCLENGGSGCQKTTSSNINEHAQGNKISIDCSTSLLPDGKYQANCKCEVKKDLSVEIQWGCSACEKDANVETQKTQSASTAE